jgi:hypothetical protein
VAKINLFSILLDGNIKDKAVTVHAFKAYRGSNSVAPLTLALNGAALPPGKEP